MANRNRSSARNPEQRKEQDKDARLGIYMGEVVSTKDVSRTGRLRVYIAALGKDKSKPSGYYDCIWVSPFAGSTDYSQLDRGDTEAYEGTHQSYGMWMVPPDIGNLVIVAFGDGNSKFPLCLGCLFPDQYNHMVPGMPAGTAFQGPSYNLPVAEKNKYDPNTEHGPGAPRPAHHDFAETLTKQGLINDLTRGPSQSGAKREAPSSVFGFLTPGPQDTNTGLRLSGHQLVMDDAIDSQQIRLRTALGNQILMDDTNGLIYVVNRDGTAWVELTPQGGINIFGEGDFNLRAKGHFNLRADKDVNIEAGGDLKFRAAGDNIYNKYEGDVPIGERPKGYGGNIRFEAAADMSQLVGLNSSVTTVSGDYELNAAGRIAATSNGSGIELFAAGGAIQAQSTRDTSFLGRNVLISTLDNTVIQSSKIMLNSGGALAPNIRTPAGTAPILIRNTFRDQPTAQPEYDRTADTALPSGGLREGDFHGVKTIVSSMLTAEPYEGHDQYDPSTEVPGSQEQDDTLVLANNSMEASGIPADVDSPNGFRAGLPSGNLSPVIQGLQSNFAPAGSRTLPATPNLTAMVSGLTSAIPPIRTPQINSALQNVVGSAMLLSELEFQRSRFGVTRDGLPADSDPSIERLNGVIDATIDVVRDDQGNVNDQVLSQKLIRNNVTMEIDGSGRIYSDASGNRLVDFSEGIGPQSNRLGVAANLNRVSMTVRNLVRVDVSDNQFLALTSFTWGIGDTNFAGSNVLEALNQSRYEEVSSLMQNWRIGAISQTNQPLVRPDYVQRRLFEGELFATPDWIPFSFNIIEDETRSFAQLRRELQAAKQTTLSGGVTF